MKPLSSLFLVFPIILSSHVFLGCDDPERPFPTVSRTGYHPDLGVVDIDAVDTSDGGNASTDPDWLERRIPSTDNGYVCYCRVEIPLNCINDYQLCGFATTGTSVTPEGSCDSGIREVHVCLPPEAVHAAEPPSFVQVEQDCTGRIQDTLREGLRATYPWCTPDRYPHLGPCDMQYGCTAIRMDGTVRSFQADRCGQDCPYIPLQWDASHQNLNFNQATYIPLSIQVYCDHPLTMDTPRVCAWQ